MNNSLNRRSFLKLAGLFPLSLAAPRFLQTPSNQKNVLIVVFDAFSAYNASLYGYARETTPNIARLAERAIVYNKHYAGGNYTTTGTASLLTGTYPWTHRAFQNNSGVANSVISHNIFNAFQKYYRIGYSHNILPITLMKQFEADIEELIPREQLLLGSYGKFIQTVLGNDEDLASVSWRRTINIDQAHYAYSLFLSRIYGPLQKNIIKNISSRFPLGVPTSTMNDGFTLEDAMDYIGKRLTEIPQPFMGYFHLLPPHDPYRTSSEFFGRFHNDGYESPQKPLSAFSRKEDRKGLSKKRTDYDEFILYVDKEFGRLYDYLQSSGILENTILVLTSDHGELNERGISGHIAGALYEPVERIPLLIFEPGRKTRLDINTVTSAVDLLPTLLHLANRTPAEWTEGVVLPPFNPVSPDPDRKAYIIRAMKNDQDKPITAPMSMTMTKGHYKIHYYAGYPGMQKNGIDESIYLFDLEKDPEELVDLSLTHKDIAGELLAELKAKLADVNQPYS